MKWFEQFAEETRTAWHKEKAFLIEEDLDKKLQQLLEEFTSKEIGDAGEAHVEILLQKKNFYTTKTKNSETPADVWGITIFKNFIHLVLIQVKTALNSETPTKLDEDDIKILRTFNKFVLTRFRTSIIVPDEMKRKVLLSSNGYVGIKIEKEENEVVSAKAFTFILPTKHNDSADLFKELVRLTYDFK